MEKLKNIPRSAVAVITLLSASEAFADCSTERVLRIIENDPAQSCQAIIDTCKRGTDREILKQNNVTADSQSTLNSVDTLNKPDGSWSYKHNLDDEYNPQHPFSEWHLDNRLDQSNAKTQKQIEAETENSCTALTS